MTGPQSTICWLAIYVAKVCHDSYNVWICIPINWGIRNIPHELVEYIAGLVSSLVAIMRNIMYECVYIPII